ncbi:hypothetical protein LC085_11955 [Bacillus tianshenii]|uniref:hypothetical protein n=1 Tax=Sutcliffiella tianshenii TaxID=1463404 RepID=UPI001CD2B06C|nr:hypothetical protein [Bacillus tianshenii]MCA1320626.1 hypothetical protein [Bacillus tianshenii]
MGIKEIFFEDASKHTKFQKVLTNILFITITLKLINRFILDFAWLESLLLFALTIIGILFLIELAIESKKNKKKV